MAKFRITTTKHVTFVYEVEAETPAAAFSMWSNELTPDDAYQVYGDHERFQESEEIEEEE